MGKLILFAVLALLVLSMPGCVRPGKGGANESGTNISVPVRPPQQNGSGNNTAAVPIENGSAAKGPNNMIAEANLTPAMQIGGGNGTLDNTTAPGANDTNISARGKETEGLLFGGKYVIFLEDITVQNGCAAVVIVDLDGKILKKDVICRGTDYYWVSPEGRRFRIVIGETAAGYTAEAVWARITIYG